jgi:hypothetical protein
MVPSLAAGAGAGVPLFPGTLKNGLRAKRLPDSSKRDLPCAGWCHPLRRSGIMVTRNLLGFEARAKKLVRAEGLEPSRALRPNGFSYPLRLSPPLLSCRRVWGLDYPFTRSRTVPGC